MTSTLGMSAKQCSPFPPGLEPNTVATASESQAEEMISQAADLAAKEMRAAAIDSIEKQLSQLGSGDNRDAVIAAVRETVLADVDKRVQEKADQLWLKGKHLVSSIQTKNKEKIQSLSDELAECLRKQGDMEAENEKLKQLLSSLAGRFSMLGSAFNAAPKMDGHGDMSTVASTMSPNQGSTASELYSPAIFTPGSASGSFPGPTDQAGGGDASASASFPELPAFPFPTGSPVHTPSTAPALSLADALLASPQPLSLASSLTPPPGSPEAAGEFAAAAGRDNTSNGYAFSFTLRKADGADLGLNVSHHEHDRVLRVEGVRSEGAVEAWNRQCASSAFSDKAVLPGDTITSVNNIMHDPKRMLEECRDRQLLKLTVYRERTAPKLSTQLRADASEFVPGAAAASEATPESADIDGQIATAPLAAAEASDAKVADADAKPEL